MICIALDTTILLQAISRRGPYRLIRNALEAGAVCLVISNDILAEYREILEREGGPTAWDQFSKIIDALRLRGNAIKEVSPQYQCRAVVVDYDDNKFVDAAFAADADYIVTSDRHFNILHLNTSIRTKPMHPDEFIARGNF